MGVAAANSDSEDDTPLAVRTLSGAPAPALAPIAAAIRAAVSAVLAEKFAEAKLVPVLGVYATFGFPVCVDGRKDAALTGETLMVAQGANLGGGKLVDKGYVWMKWMANSTAAARCLNNHAICQLSPDVQGRPDHFKAYPICYNYLDFLNGKKVAKVLQQQPGGSKIYRVISEEEANLFKPTGVAQQGALTHFFTWEVNKYTEYGPDDPLAEGMPIFAPLQSWGVQLEAPSSPAFDMGKFAFWSDALEERDSNWIEQHRAKAGQMPAGEQRDIVLTVGRVGSMVGGPWPSSGDKRKEPPVD
jgi:hypothetical protein